MSFQGVVLTIVLLSASSTLQARNSNARYGQNGQAASSDQGQQQEHREFDNHDRQVLKDWYRGQAARSGAAADEDIWTHRTIGIYLQPGVDLDEDMKSMAQPVPPEVASQLGPLPHDWRYRTIGYNTCIVDGNSAIRDVFHFDPFDDQNRKAVQNWAQDHPNALQQAAGVTSAQTSNGNPGEGIETGRVVEPDVRALAQAAPEDLVSRLAPAPFNWQYTVIENHLCLVDRDWRVHEAFPLHG